MTPHDKTQRVSRKGFIRSVISDVISLTAIVVIVAGTVIILKGMM